MRHSAVKGYEGGDFRRADAERNANALARRKYDPSLDGTVAWHLIIVVGVM